ERGALRRLAVSELEVLDREGAEADVAERDRHAADVDRARGGVDRQAAARQVGRGAEQVADGDPAGDLEYAVAGVVVDLEVVRGQGDAEEVERAVDDDVERLEDAVGDDEPRVSALAERGRDAIEDLARPARSDRLRGRRDRERTGHLILVL